MNPLYRIVFEIFAAPGAISLDGKLFKDRSEKIHEAKEGCHFMYHEHARGMIVERPDIVATSKPNYPW